MLLRHPMPTMLLTHRSASVIITSSFKLNPGFITFFHLHVDHFVGGFDETAPPIRKFPSTKSLIELQNSTGMCVNWTEDKRPLSSSHIISSEQAQPSCAPTLIIICPFCVYRFHLQTPTWPGLRGIFKMRHQEYLFVCVWEWRTQQLQMSSFM